MSRYLNVRLCVVLTALVAFSASMAAGWFAHQQAPRRSAAAWKQTFNSLEGMTAGVDAIAVVRVTAVTPGRVAFSGDGGDALPFELVQTTVVQGIKGVGQGDAVTIERAGGTAPDGAAVQLDIDGGEFEEGGTYLMFLKKQEDGPYFYQVNDEGRFRSEGGRLRAVRPDGDVAGVLHGRALGEAIALIAQSRGGR